MFLTMSAKMSLARNSAEVFAVAEHERRIDDAEAFVPLLEIVHGLDEEVLRPRNQVLELHGDRLPELGGVEDLNLDLAVGQLSDPLGHVGDRRPLLRNSRLEVAHLQLHFGLGRRHGESGGERDRRQGCDKAFHI